MRPDARRRLGRLDLEPTVYAVGTAPLGNLYRRVEEDVAQATIDRAWRAGVRLFDTAPMYGHGVAELRLGQALRWRPREEYLLSTKVGRLLEPAPRGAIDPGAWDGIGPFRIRYDYGYDGALRSIEDSLQRLAVEGIDIALIHDVDRFTHGAEQPARFREAMRGAYRALERLRDEGAVRAIGLGVNEANVCSDALIEGDFDVFLLAGRYTLLEQDPLDDLLPRCLERGVGVLIGGGFNSGILASGAGRGATYDYRPAPEEVIAKVAAIEEVCARRGVALPAAAMQFPLAHPAVSSFVAGVRSPEQVEQNLAWLEAPIEPAFWRELAARGLVREDAPTPC